MSWNIGKKKLKSHKNLLKIYKVIIILNEVAYDYCFKVSNTT